MSDMFGFKQVKQMPNFPHGACDEMHQIFIDKNVSKY